MPQRMAGDVFHRVIQRAVGNANVIQSDNVRMIQLGCDFELAQKIAPRLIGRHTGTG